MRSFIGAYHDDDKGTDAGLLGSIVTRDFEEIGTLTVAYCTDPEGNFIEIQNWSKEGG